MASVGLDDEGPDDRYIPEDTFQSPLHDRVPMAISSR